MIKYTTYRWAMGLCALLLVAAALPLSARDAALPPGADFQEGFQGASVHPRQKRGVGLVKWTMVTMKYWQQRGYTLIRGRLYSEHARMRLCLDSTRCTDPRMTPSGVEDIIKNGTSYWDNKEKRIVRIKRYDGGVVLATPTKDGNTPDGIVITLLTRQEVNTKIYNGRYTELYSRKN